MNGGVFAFMSSPPAPNPFSLGLDFGTTNTVIAASTQAGSARTLPFSIAGETHPTFRSAMCFWEEDTGAAQDLRFEAGPWAIERFIDDPVDCRFLQSFKTFAASRSFTRTSSGDSLSICLKTATALRKKPWSA